MSSDEELLSGGESALEMQVQKARQMIQKASAFIIKLKTEKSEIG